MARAAYVYPDTAADLGAVIAKCDEMGGSAAEGLGYGIAFVFAKGSLEVGAARLAGPLFMFPKALLRCWALLCISFGQGDQHVGSFGQSEQQVGSEC